MGNRAVITTENNFNNNGIGIYLHWNGGRDSVKNFLKYCEIRGDRAPSQDSYGWARLTQVISNFFGGGLSIGIDTVDKLDCDNYDNGVYLIDGWEIVGRKYFNGNEQSGYDQVEFLLSLDESMPEKERIGAAGICEKLGVPIPESYKADEKEEKTEKEPDKQEPEQEVCTVSYKLNEEKNGVEIYFSCKPTDETRTKVKDIGFRWNRKKACWYAKQSEETISFAFELSNTIGE